MSYYYLKKILLSNTLSFDTNKSYLEFININGLKPNPIPVKVKVIIVGDYESYDILLSVFDIHPIFHQSQTTGLQKYIPPGFSLQNTLSFSFFYLFYFALN